MNDKDINELKNLLEDTNKLLDLASIYVKDFGIIGVSQLFDKQVTKVKEYLENL